MEILPIIFFIAFFLPGIVALTDLIAFIALRRFYVNKAILVFMSCVALILYPMFYIAMETENNCCSDSAAFSPDHVLSIFTLIVCYCASYFYSLKRTKITSPVLEVCMNAFLILGIVLNVFVAIHTDELFMAALGNLPAIVFLINMLLRNHQFLFTELDRSGTWPTNKFESLAVKILYWPAFAKFPVLIVLCLPLLAILIALLLIFGQKPDSFIRAFTETYKHGFSEWDYKCDNVHCGGHYLCSVAANGHPDVVKPQRLGMRHGNYIICNRQLLISNAFEELIAEKLPFAHKIIRRNYDKVGDVVHRYYGIFNNKYVSDTVYILMKPAEWLFIAVLYTFDAKPENRIAKQYLSVEDRRKLSDL
jgi:hypothetical protein